MLNALFGCLCKNTLSPVHAPELCRSKKFLHSSKRDERNRHWHREDCAHWYNARDGFKRHRWHREVPKRHNMVRWLAKSSTLVKTGSFFLRACKQTKAMSMHKMSNIESWSLIGCIIILTPGPLKKPAFYRNYKCAVKHFWTQRCFYGLRLFLPSFMSSLIVLCK
jgi:hypothetical protein